MLAASRPMPAREWDDALSAWARARLAEGESGLDATALERFERSEEHTSELQSLMRISYAVFCVKKIRKDIRHFLKTQRDNRKHPALRNLHKNTNSYNGVI